QRTTPDLLDESIYNFDAARLTQVLARSGDQFAISTILDRGYKVYRFELGYLTLQFNDGSVEERAMPGLRGVSEHDRKRIYIKNELSLQEAASTLFHEVQHLTINAPRVDEETQVRIATEHFRIRQGMPPKKPAYRNADGTVNEAAIRADVQGNQVYAQSD